jgi:two-component system CheB/CheR fusion protein
LEAFRQLLKHLPTDTGLGFVLVQHLDPQHESALTQLLTRATSMPVREVTDNLRVEANHVYVIPPNANLGIAKGVLKLQPRPQTGGAHRSIDSFLESLAPDQRERAIGVILSGTATDGTLGLEAIKAEGGITFAQDESAKYDSMPRSAVAAGCVDFVLSPEKIARELARIAKHPYVAGQPTEPHSEPEEPTDGETPVSSRGRGPLRPSLSSSDEEWPGSTGNGFKKMIALLRNRSGVDFTLYKPNTIERRINRRMVLSKLTSADDYAGNLRGNPKELDALYSDLLINVTGFFRNPEAFDSLKSKAFPKLVKDRSGDPLRVWVPGCSTGQEAYSLAMAFQEFFDQVTRVPKLQIFATDVNAAVLDKARAGLYSKTVVADVSPERLRRFFAEEQGGYRISKGLREMIVFAPQNLLSDPPFSRMDLITCRNLLIYLEPSSQKKAVPTFHYALKPTGFLFLGASESISGYSDLFEPVDKKHRIYSRKPGPTPALKLEFAPRDSVRQGAARARAPERTAEGPNAELNTQREADRVAASRHAPPSLLVNADLQVLQFRGETSPYLRSPTGRPTVDLLKLAREGLVLPLRTALNKAKKENKVVRKENAQIVQNGQTRTATIEVVPLRNLKERCFLIFFEEATEREAPKLPTRPHIPAAPRSNVKESRHVADLKQELAEKDDYLQTIQEQYEAANEELQASSEEVTSANEELQSINEELETSKEELESANEELTTINDEMANRNVELSRLNSDLHNLHTSVNLPILVVARDLTIRSFTPMAEKLFNLLATDIGRPLSGVRHNLDFPGLEQLLKEVIDTVSKREREIQDKDGRWYALRARPYLTLDNKIDGAILVLVDIDDLKRTEEQIRQASNYAEATIRTARDPLVVLRADLRVDQANDAFYKTFKLTPAETEGVLIYQVGDGQWDIPKLRQFLEDIIPRNSFFNDLEVVHEFPHFGRRTMLLNGRRLDSSSGTTERILLGIEDITERMRIDEEVHQSDDRYRLLFDLGPVAVYSIDTSGVIQNFNRRAAELWGREPVPGDTDERFCGSYKMFRPDGSFMPHEQCPMAEVVSGKIPAAHDVEVLIQRPDGSRVAVIVNIRPLKNERGEITGAINCFYDITRRKQTEEALLASENRLASELAATKQLQETSTLLIQQGNPDALYQRILDAGIALMSSDMASIQIVDDSQDALRMLAWRGFDATFGEIFGLNRRNSNTSCTVAWRTGNRVVVPDVETCDFIVGTTALEDHRKAGIRAVQSTPLVSRGGRLIGVISTHWRQPHQPAKGELRLVDVLARQAADLIERVQTEEARAKLASIVESSDDAIVSKDLNGIITSWNKGAERLFGYTAQETIGQSVTMLIPQEHLDEEPSILARIREGKAIDHYETVRRRKDGTLINLSLTVSPIRNDQGRIVGASKIARDITDRKKAEQALRKSEALLASRATQLEQLVTERTARLQDTISELEHFSYTITHDMRAPLRAMQGFGGMLLSESRDRLTPESGDYLRRIVEGARRMDALIQDSLQYAKIIRERIPLEPIEPAPVLRGILETYPTLQSPKAEIELVEPFPPICANESGLAQCFSNLLANAIKFVKPGKVPHVRVWAEARGDLVRFWFEDNGIGIPPEYHERIFEMFHQLDKSYEGTGIGLALVRKTAERMDGKVGVESELGKGSRFWLEFRRPKP